MNDSEFLSLAVEFGYKACERGLNIQAALADFREKILQLPTPAAKRVYLKDCGWARCDRRGIETWCSPSGYYRGGLVQYLSLDSAYKSQKKRDTKKSEVCDGSG